MHEARPATTVELARLDPEILAERRGPDRWEQDLRVPADLSCWPGHFPGQPILPGVLQLDWAMKLLARWLGEERWPRRVEALKFKDFVRPGETLTLALEREPGQEDFRFQLTHGTTVFSLGRIVVSGSASTISGVRVARVSAPDLPAVAEIIPHAGAMVLLAQVVSHSGDETVCSARIDEVVLLRSASGEVPVWMGLEYMAQCIAAYAGMVGRANGEPPRVGLLLGSRRVTFHVPGFRCGQRLLIRARRVWGGLQGMVAFECSIADDDTGLLLAEGRLNCFMPGNASVGEER